MSNTQTDSPRTTLSRSSAPFYEVYKSSKPVDLSSSFKSLLIQHYTSTFAHTSTSTDPSNPNPILKIHILITNTSTASFPKKSHPFTMCTSDKVIYNCGAVVTTIHRCESGVGYNGRSACPITSSTEQRVARSCQECDLCRVARVQRQIAAEKKAERNRK